MPQSIVGGKAILYTSVLTLDLGKITIKSGEPHYDQKDDYIKVRCRVLKNHCCGARNPYTVTDYYVRIGKGIDTQTEVLEEAYAKGIIEKAPGGWFRVYPEGVEPIKGNEMEWNGTKCCWRGVGNFQTFIDENPDFFEYITGRVTSNEGTALVQSMSAEEIKQLQEVNDIDLDELESVLNGEDE